MATEPRRVKIRPEALVARRDEIRTRNQPTAPHPRDVEFEAFCKLGRARRRQRELYALGCWTTPEERDVLDQVTEECVRLETEYAAAKRAYNEWLNGELAGMAKEVCT